MRVDALRGVNFSSVVNMPNELICSGKGFTECMLSRIRFTGGFDARTCVKLVLADSFILFALISVHGLGYPLHGNPNPLALIADRLFLRRTPYAEVYTGQKMKTLAK